MFLPIEIVKAGGKVGHAFHPRPLEQNYFEYGYCVSATLDPLKDTGSVLD